MVQGLNVLAEGALWWPYHGGGGSAAQHEVRTPMQGYAETREAAMAAFTKRWRREN
jgi:hypothetical protein